MLTALTANNAKGIVATIPDVTGIPFFTTVGPQIKASLAAKGVPGMVALTGKGAARIQLARQGIKSPVTTRNTQGAPVDQPGGTLLFTLTAAPYAPLIGTATGKYWRELARTTNPGNPTLASAQLAQFMIGFQLDTTQLFGVSAGNPWPSALLLDNAEQAEVQAFTSTFNNHIKSQAAAKNLAVFDAFEYFNSIQPTYVNDQLLPKLSLNGVAYSPAFISGNLFSLDGVHPTPRGYAFIANEMIKAINKKYNTSIPTVDVTRYRAVLIPNGN
jgi:lysophospholipase L1-like esterase